MANCDASQLHPVTNPEERHHLLARVPDREHLAFDPARTEAGRHKNAGHAVERLDASVFEHFGIDANDFFLDSDVFGATPAW